MSLPPVAHKAAAFLRRDLRIAMSYQLNFLLTSLNSFFILAMLWFIGRMVDPRAAGLAASGGSYFAFALVGYGSYQYFQLWLSFFSGTVQNEQMSGCLEAVVATRTPPEQIILFSSLYANVMALFQLLVIMAAGVLLFGVDLSRADAPAAFLAFVLSTTVFSSFGILSASFIVVLKKGDPFGWAVMTLNFVFGGAFFPLEQMPSWMRALANVVPATYSLDALRRSLLAGQGIDELARPLIVLGALALILFPLSLRAFRLAIRRARKEGSLVFY